jgi:hypothetical protein
MKKRVAVFFNLEFCFECVAEIEMPGYVRLSEFAEVELAPRTAEEVDADVRTETPEVDDERERRIAKQRARMAENTEAIARILNG